jgi:tetratricopeptide (TPR) repeat protein
MKRFPDRILRLSHLFVLGTTAALLWLSTPSRAVESSPEVAPTTLAESLIPKSQEDRYQDLVNAAMEEFQKNNYEAALEKIKVAAEIYPRDPFILNLKGAIYTKLKNWEEARRFFNRALNEDPNFFPARYNLGEILFLEGDKVEALRYFEALNDIYRGNDLIQFKLVLLFLLNEKDVDARRIAERIRFPGNTPAWYFAQAALAFSDGNRREGRRILNSARELFSEEQIALFQESLDEAELSR